MVRIQQKQLAIDNEPEMLILQCRILIFSLIAQLIERFGIYPQEVAGLSPAKGSNLKLRNMKEYLEPLMFAIIMALLFILNLQFFYLSIIGIKNTIGITLWEDMIEEVVEH